LIPFIRGSIAAMPTHFEYTDIRRLSLFIRVIFTTIFLTHCGPTLTPTPLPETTPEPTSQTASLSLPSDYEAEVVVRGLRGQTQMILGPDGDLWVGQLAGGENEGQGQIVAISLTSGEQRILLDDLFKPTGLAVLAEALWIAAGRDLLRVPLNETGQVGTPEIILKELPFNTRSEGTLTVSPAGRLIFETSGQRSGNQAVEGSGQLWELDPTDPTNPRPLASGLKNAYGHTFDAAGRLWLTEIHDGVVNGEAPPDEVNLWLQGADFGWPGCFGFQQAALNYGGSVESCRATRPPVALFPPHSTPTSIVLSPWEENTLLVALWGPAETTIVRVSFTLAGDNAIGQVEPFLTGMQNPQHLLLLPEGRLLASDFRTGLIYQISPLSAK
jgi:glucose/arabinose dehydrogenase